MGTRVHAPARLRSLVGGLTAAAVVAASLTALPVLPAPPAAAATTNQLSLHVASARTEPRAFGGAGVTKGAAVDHFTYIINVDRTGTTAQRSAAPGSGCSTSDAGYPAGCRWPSIDEDPGGQAIAPIYRHGDETDLTGGNTLTLPDGRYLISVLAEGYKIDGAHFTVPLQDPGLVDVELQPNPLPDSTLRGQVFADMAPTNGTLDVGDAPLTGFQGHINDYLGEVTTDVYGNPLCTTYVGEDPVTHEIPLANLDADMLPVVDQPGGKCLSDADGLLTIPHLGTNRYALSATPPDGQEWIQTTTLEGNHDWDAWIMEGGTGFDTEFAIAGEPVPQPLFGFAKPTKNGQPLDAAAAGHITGVVVGIKTYTPPKGGSFDGWGGNTGTRINKPIVRPWLSLADLENGDAAVWVGQGDANGAFDISGVPDGNYTLTWWDEPQDYNVNFINVTVTGGETVAMGNVPLNGWWTEYDGYVYNDTNRNAVKDPGEPGIPNFTLTLRRRENSLMDRGQNTATTDASGYYHFEAAYPIGEWFVLEAYNDSFYTTGVTYQADNQPTPTTVKGAGVDVSTLPIIGLSGRMDWGVHAYDAPGTGGVDPRNGGIVGTVSYDTTRNELDPQYAVAEDWQPGVSDVPVELYATVPCTESSTVCDDAGRYELAADGSYARGKLLNTYLSEHWVRPTGCTARDVDGNPLVHGTDENVLVPSQETSGECISSFIQGIQFGPYPTDQGTPDANFGAAVDGNYGFGDGCFDGTLDASDPADPVCTGGTFTALGAADYLVHIAVPDDASGSPMYQVTSEEDINIGNGDQIVPQVPPPACAGALHTVDVAGMGTDGYAALVGDGTNGAPAGVTVAASTPVDNATFVDIGGSPYEGMPKPRCDTKLVTVNNGKSIVPLFNVFTDVPIPTRMRGLIVDDVNFSKDSRSIMYGEKAGIPFVPVGIYDFANRLAYTVESDFNGEYDVLMPSTNHISCPTPSGVCANMYRFVANDPGVPGRLNPNYDPRYRTIATEFEAFPGLLIPTDLAPTQVGLTIESPATGLPQAVRCVQGDTTPQLLAVSRPYVNGSGTFSIEGTGFGATKGTGAVLLDSTVLPTTSWSNTHIDVSVPSGTAVGAHQLAIRANNGASTVNGLTFHVRGGSYSPNVYEVGPAVSTPRYNPTNAASRSALGVTHAIQNALDDARASAGDDLVVVYPGTPDLADPRGNPRGAYYENLIMASPVKLQGVGPGGFQGSTFVPGSIIDAGAFGGDTDLATDWFNAVGALTWDGDQTANDGQAIYVLASENATTVAGRARQFTSGYRATIDGFDIRGGDQQGFPGNINDLTGGPTGLPPGIQTQGGAIFANAFARYLQVTNNVVQNNGGAYGTIRIGTPDLPAPDTSQHNENIRISDNRIIANAGTNLAGAIGIFAGAEGYEIARNDICGNFSMEYGGGVSVYGLSPQGKIHHNRIYYNMSNDEGGGIMVAGQLPADPSALSPGSGTVDISSNRIQANLANDDGGGIRFLMAGNFPMNVSNNDVVNNVSTHEGGGISLDDAPNVRIVNNTIMKNLTTATAVTSDGSAMPAGISTTSNSEQLQATLPAGSPTFSNPLLFNDILWDNRAGTRAGTTVLGLGLAGDATPIDHWDIGVSDGTGTLAPTNSVIQQPGHPYVTSATNSTSDPGVVSPYDLTVSFATWRQNPAFVDASLVAVEAPPELMGDYHLAACPASPACNRGAASKAVPAYQAPPTTFAAPALDIDDQVRPALGGFDAGADEFGAATPPTTSPVTFLFSTSGDSNPPGVSGTADNADIYRWDGTAYSRSINATTIGIPASANVDGYSQVDATHFYLSFSDATVLPGLGTVQDEDVVYRNGTTWQLYFDGTTHGLATTDLDAIHVDATGMYFSTSSGVNPPGVAGTADDSDIYRWNGGNSFTRALDATTVGIPASANVDGYDRTDATHQYVSFSGDTSVSGLGAVQDEDVILRAGTTWQTWFDGTANGLISANLDIDAFSLPATGTAPPPPRLFLTPTSSISLPGLAESVANEDIVWFDGKGYSLLFDGSDVLGSLSTRITGFARVSSTTLLLSFANSVTLPGVGAVTPSDIVKFTGTLGPASTGTFSMYLDGSDVGLTTLAEAITSFDLLPTGDLVVSTRGGVGVTGIAASTTTGSDIFRFHPAALGGTTSGTWSWYLDGSDVGLGGGTVVNALAESISGLSVSGAGAINLSTLGSFSVPGVSGSNRDVFTCGAPTTGAASTCTWSTTKYFTGSTSGFPSALNPPADLDLP
ncbi:SdrD B-like domain-containing protein [Intrasporangium sp.]|uniref:SdrD B-like domain-containing protein n=1 Tax=Intrasporangium sp. TaxID=1925024 RepID=UPI003365644D